MQQESQNSFGNQPTHHIPMDIFDDIYGRQQLHAEQAIDPTSERLRDIASDIDEARRLRLDSQLFSQQEINRRRFPVDIAKILFGGVIASHRLEPLTEKILRDEESKKVGADIFGPLSPNETQREFFYDRSTQVEGTGNVLSSWFFHHKIFDPKTNKTRERTLHYEPGREEGVLRISSHPGTPNTIIGGKELEDFISATEMYHEGVMGLYPEYTSSLGSAAKPQVNTDQPGELHQLRRDDNQTDDRLAA